MSWKLHPLTQEVIFHDFMILSSADFFSKSNFSKNSFRNSVRLSNKLDPYQARRYVGSDLGSNCLQMLSADDTGKKRVKICQKV